MIHVVIDTNVPVTANGHARQAGPGCVQACIRRLRDARGQCVLLDSGPGEILKEYRLHLSPSGQPGPGDAWFKWLWTNQANPSRCRQVEITRTDAPRLYEEFPDDPELATFDLNDRKFVAVALASQVDPTIVNAVDSDWADHAQALNRHGVQVEQLCT